MLFLHSLRKMHTEEAQQSALLSLLIEKEEAAITLEVCHYVNTEALNQEITLGHLCTETLFAGAFNSGVGRESREITLKNARKKIQALAQQLRLRPDHIDMVRQLKKQTTTSKKNHIDMARISLH